MAFNTLETEIYKYNLRSGPLLFNPLAQRYAGLDSGGETRHVRALSGASIALRFAALWQHRAFATSTGSILIDKLMDPGV